MSKLKFSEEAAADAFLQADFPPFLTCGDAWHILRANVWEQCDPKSFYERARKVIPEPLRTSRRVLDVIRNVGQRKQVPSGSLQGFREYKGNGVYWVNTNERVLELTRDEIRVLPPSQTHRFTLKVPVTYTPEAVCPFYDKILDQLLPDPQDKLVLRAWGGYLLSPTNRFEVALVSYGPTGCGKSTVADAFRAVLGSELVTNLSMHHLADPKSYSLPKLQHAALNITSELSFRRVNDTAAWKQLVSGEAMEVREIRAAPEDIKPKCKLMFSANSVPNMDDSYGAVTRRLRTLKFDQQFVRDPTVKEQIAEEASGIFNQMLKHFQWLRTVSEFPSSSESSQGVLERFSVKNNPVAAFVKERCILSPDDSIPCDHLKAAFEIFVEDHALPAWTGQKFFTHFRDNYYGQIVDYRPRIPGPAITNPSTLKRLRRYRGVSLKPEYLQDVLSSSQDLPDVDLGGLSIS